MSAETCKNSLGAYMRGHADGLYGTRKSFAEFTQCQCEECESEYNDGFEDGRNLAIDRVGEENQ